MIIPTGENSGIAIDEAYLKESKNFPELMLDVIEDLNIRTEMTGYNPNIYRLELVKDGIFCIHGEGKTLTEAYRELVDYIVRTYP